MVLLLYWACSVSFSAPNVFCCEVEDYEFVSRGLQCSYYAPALPSVRGYVFQFLLIRDANIGVSIAELLQTISRTSS